MFCLFISQLMDIWVVSAYWLLWIMLMWTFTYKFLCGCLFWLLLSTYLGVEFLGHGNPIFNFLRHCQTVFQSHCTILHLNQQCMKLLIPLHSGQQLLICLFDYSHPPEREVISHCSLICFSEDVSIFSCAYWPFVNFLWRNVHSYPLPIFKLGYLFIIDL